MIRRLQSELKQWNCRGEAVAFCCTARHMYIIYKKDYNSPQYIQCIATSNFDHAASFRLHDSKGIPGAEPVYPNCYVYSGTNESLSVVTMATPDCHYLKGWHRRKNGLHHLLQTCLGMGTSSLTGRRRQSASPSTLQQGSGSWRGTERGGRTHRVLDRQLGKWKETKGVRRIHRGVEGYIGC